MRVLFIICFIMCYACLFLMHKSEEKLNAASWSVLCLIGELCFGAIGAGIIAVFSVPVTLVSMGFVFFAIGCAGLLHLVKHKKVQKYQWKVWELCCMSALAAVVVIIYAENYGGIAFGFVFWNSDPAVHLKNAMWVVRNHDVTGMYFSSLYAGILIELLSPLAHAVNYYKIFIIADCLAVILHMLMFFVLIRDSLTTWKRRAAGICICLCYLGGYPLICFYQGFFYWGIGVLLIGFVIYMAGCYRQKRIQRELCIWFLMGGCAGVVLCYMLFAPVVYIALFLSLAAAAAQEGKMVTYQNAAAALKIFFVPCILGLYYCFFQFFAQDGSTISGAIGKISESIAAEGGIYRELYSNFLLILPIVLYWIFNRIKERNLEERVVFILILGCAVLLFFMLAYKGKISSYYYYKWYYPLWLLFFAIFTSALFELYEKQKTMLLSYITVFLFLAVMSFGGIEDRIISNHMLQPVNRSASFFDIYLYNKGMMETSGGVYDHNILDLCDFVMKEIGEDGNIPIVTSLDTYAYWFWYDAITGNESESHFYDRINSWEKYKEVLEKENCKYVVVINSSEIYQNHKAFWSAFECVKENSLGKVLKIR